MMKMMPRIQKQALCSVLESKHACRILILCARRYCSCNIACRTTKPDLTNSEMRSYMVELADLGLVLSHKASRQEYER